MLPSNSLSQLCILCFCIGCLAAINFSVGEVVIARNLKWKKDERIHEAVHRLNNSYVKIISHNTHLEPRKEFTIQLLEDSSIRLAVPKKKLRHLSQIVVYDYSNATFGLLISKFNELADNPLNHVIVLPFFPNKFCSLLLSGRGWYMWRDSRMQRNHVLNLMERRLEYDNLLFTAKYRANGPPMTATRLWKALHFMEQNIPKELWVAMKQKIIKWAQTQSDPQYFIIALTCINRKLLEFAVDSNRNLILIRKMQEIVRVIQRKHPRARIRDLDWMSPMKQEIGSKVLEYWLRANDPKIFDQRHYVHVLWKWNDFADIEFIDIDPQDVFHDAALIPKYHGTNFQPRYHITSGDRDLWPKQYYVLHVVVGLSYLLMKENGLYSIGLIGGCVLATTACQMLLLLFN